VPQTDFQAGPRVLLYPSASHFQPAHFGWLNTTKLSRHPLLCYALDAISMPEHELMHVIQIELKMTDQKGWGMEHDASRVALVVHSHLSFCRLFEMADLMVIVLLSAHESAGG
jgi:hypothetical protein